MSLAAAAAVAGRPPGLAPWGLFMGLLAMAGLPIYIHAPRVYAEAHGVGLGALGAVLAALRLLDVVQDPGLGWLAARLGAWRGAAVAAALALMAAAMVALYAVPPLLPPLWWFALALTVLFSAFSFLTICLYAAGVAEGVRLGPGGHVRLAGWREAGGLLGLCLAAVAPALLAGTAARPHAAFAVGFAALAPLAWMAMRGRWAAAATAPATGPALRSVLADPPARRLLVTALVNAAPVAVTATLFLFFVEARLAAAAWAGPLLVAFFLAAAAAAPGWARLARRIGPRLALLAGMALSVAGFGWAAMLGPGDVAAFAVVCVLSGAALGADMTLLPALFAARMARIAPDAAAGFGLWSFAGKATLALAAGVALPLLGAAGFEPAAGAANPADALRALGLLYAVLPCVLKLVAMALVARLPLKGE